MNEAQENNAADELNEAVDASVQFGELVAGDVVKKQTNVKEEHLKTTTLPAIVMLTAGGATAIMCFVSQYSVLRSLALTLGALVLFLIVGEIAKLILDRIVIRRKPQGMVGKDGEVIEKGTAAGSTADSNSGG